MDVNGLKFGVLAGTTGELRDRFATYHKPVTFADECELLGGMSEVRGVELVYPFMGDDPQPVRVQLEQAGLEASAINVNLKHEERFHLGGPTSRDPGVRRAALEHLASAIRLARELDAEVVTVCPIADGTDYAFEADYRWQWSALVEFIGEAAALDPSVRLAVEYKVSEPRARVILPTAGICLHLCNEVDLENLGVTLDFGHSIQAGEIPAQAASLLSDAGRLLLVHVNDNYRDWDWDLVPGAANFWEWIEFLLYLEDLEYSGWMTADIFPARTDPGKSIAACHAAIAQGLRLLDHVGRERLWQLIQVGEPLAALSHLQSRLIGHPNYEPLP